MKTVTYILVILFFFNCNLPNKSRPTDETAHSDSVSELKDSADNREAEADTIVTQLIKYEKDGLLLPDAYTRYDNSFNQIGKLTVDSISAIKILEKSMQKHPEFAEEHYCNHLNIVKAVYRQDTLIISGKSLLEITFMKTKKLGSNQLVTVLLAENFTPGAMSDEGLTGCDEYSYIILRPENENYTLVEAANNEQSGTAAILRSDAGMHEEIEHIKLDADTVILDISVQYHEGGAKYKLKIYKDTSWRFFKSDRMEF